VPPVVGTSTRTDADALGLVLLGALQGQGQHTIRQLGLNLVRVHLERQPKRPPKAAPPALAAMVGSGVLGLILTLTPQGDRVSVNGDLELVLLDPGQLGGDDDAVLVGVDVDGWEAG